MKKVLIVLLICALIAGGIGIYLWNKPHKKVENSTGVPVTAVALCKAYGSNEKQANTMYLNKPLDVTGEISDITTNQDGGTVIMLKSDDPILAVQCTMRDKGVKAQKGSTVTVKGFCSGNDIASVLLTDCILK